MISVIVPAYNATKFLHETVQSVQAQTFSKWELIIVDDGSNDDTLIVAKEIQSQDSRISVFSQANSGAATARNFGLTKSIASHPYALFLDSDDLLIPTALQTLLLALESQPEAPAACGFMQDVDAAGKLITGYHRFEPLDHRRGIEGSRLVRRNPDESLVFGDLCFHNHIITPGQVLIRKSVLETIGAFDVSLVYVEDYDLWWRLVMQEGPILVIPVPVLLYRHHSSSISGNRAAVRRGNTDFRWRLLTYPKMSLKQLQVARIGYLYKSLIRWEFALYYLRSGKIKQGLKQGGLGIREMLYFIRDVNRLRRTKVASTH